MQQRLVLAALAVALTVPLPAPGAGEPERARGESFIKAEVRGTLRFETGHGYYIAVRSKGEAERETRVWLLICEDKVLVRQLQGLEGKQVRAEGDLEQMPDNVNAGVPPHGLYLGEFKIEGVSDKAK
jgi:hypothetical protein